MCTVSWRLAPEGYDVFFNRDERHTRAPEQPPRIDERSGVNFIAPRDGDRGGTWLLANESALTVCLLNDYANPWRPAAGVPLFSRGDVVLACAAAHDFAEVNETVGAQPLSRTPPFRLLAISPAEGARLLHWNGSQLVHSSASSILRPPLSSSSYSTVNVITARLGRFNAVVRNPAAPLPSELFDYHRQHTPDCGAYSVLMSRSDAATRSIIHVSVTPMQVRLNYRAVLNTPRGPMIEEPVELSLPRNHPALSSGAADLLYRGAPLVGRES